MALAAAAPGGLNGAADRAARADRSVNSGATPADSAFSRMLDRSRDSLAGTAAEQATNRSPEPSEQRYAQRQAEARDRESEAVRGRETGARSPIERALEARQAQRRLDEARARDQQVRERQSINTAAANADATEMASGRAMSNEAAPRAVSAARPATSSDRKAGASSMPAEPSSDTTETVVGEGRPGVAKDIASDLSLIHI